MRLCHVLHRCTLRYNATYSYFLPHMANVAPAGVTPVARLALSLAILVLNGPTKKIKQPGCLDRKANTHHHT